MTLDTSPFQRLLLATEHSEFDQGSERLALALARQLGRPLRALLPLRSNAEFESVAPQLAARADAAAAAHLAELEASAAAAGVAWQASVRRGPQLAPEIVDEARAQASDLIIIRRRGRQGVLAQLLVGEMVGQVIAQAPCSVLTVPRQAPLWSRGILVAVHPRSPDAAALAQGAALAAAFELPLKLVAVADGHPSAVALQLAQASLAAALAQARRVWPRAEAELLHGAPSQQLLQAAQVGGIDLIVVGRHSVQRWRQAWSGGHVHRLIGHADCAVLVAAAPGLRVVQAASAAAAPTPAVGAPPPESRA